MRAFGSGRQASRPLRPNENDATVVDPRFIYPDPLEQDVDRMGHLLISVRVGATSPSPAGEGRITRRLRVRSLGPLVWLLKHGSGRLKNRKIAHPRECGGEGGGPRRRTGPSSASGRTTLSALVRRLKSAVRRRDEASVPAEAICGSPATKGSLWPSRACRSRRARGRPGSFLVKPETAGRVECR